MDDKAFQDWSERLSQLRQLRRDAFEVQLKKTPVVYQPQQFFEAARASLTLVSAEWWAIEEKSWSSFPPADAAGELERLRSESDSLFEFEVESLVRDLEFVRERLSWEEDEVAVELTELTKFSEQLNQSYHVKIEAMAMASQGKVKEPAIIKPPPTKTAAAPRRTSGSGSSGTPSGISLVVMLLLGLLFGGGFSFYFWDSANKSALVSDEKLVKLTREKKEVEDSVALVQHTFTQLAEGKIKNLPELEKAMSPIQESARDARRKIENDFNLKKENVLKTVPAGDKQDKTLSRMEDLKKEMLENVNRKEREEVDPYKKQYDTLKELVGN